MSSLQDFVIENGVLREYKGSGGDVVIPEGVREIYNAFWDCESLTSVVIPEGVTTIGGAFRGCTSLTSVVIPKSVVQISPYAFEDCPNLVKCDISPDSPVFSVHSGCVIKENRKVILCLGGTKGEVKFPEYITEMYGVAFSYCQHLTSVVIPEGVTEIDYDAFRGCTSLTSIAIPKSVVKIPSGAFEDCPNLVKCDISPDSPVFSVHSGCLIQENRRVRFCLRGTKGEVKLPEYITEIESGAFSDCQSLTSVVIPEGVTEIDYGVFQGCTSLTSVVIPKSVVRISPSAFEDCPNLVKCDISPDSPVFSVDGGCVIKENREVTLCLSGIKGEVKLPEYITEIESGAFSDCQSLTSVVIPEGVTEINYRVFQGCTSLTSVVIPKSVVRIFRSAFEDCPNLVKCDISPDSPVFSVDGGCVIQENRTVILCLGGTKGEVKLPEYITEIGYDAFSGCQSLTSVIIPEGVTEIGAHAFSDCQSLTSVAIPKGVTEIGEYAFSDCQSLTKITIPESVNKIGAGAFENSGIKTISNAADLLLNGCKISDLSGDGSVFCSAENLEHAAAVCLTQSGKTILAKFEPALYANVNQTVSAMARLLAGKKRKPTYYKKAAEFALGCEKELDREVLLELDHVLTAAKAKAAELLKEAVQAAETTQPEAPERTVIDPAEAFCREHYSEANVNRLLKKCGLSLQDIPAVPYKDNGANAPSFVVACVLAAYMGMVEKGKYRSALTYDRDADQLAAALEPAAFQQALEELYQRVSKGQGIPRGREILVPVCRFGSPQQLKQVISGLRSWNDWYCYGQAGRKTVELARDAICLSPLREALLWAEKNGKLSFAAELRGTSIDTLRDTVLFDFGLDGQGRKVYDLGGNTVTVSIGADLTLTLYDETAHKTVKSIPKKNADPERYEAAKADFADLKKNMKKTVKLRIDQLFQDFLRGKAQLENEWEAAYQTNPVLGSVARLLVWEQNKTTFTLGEQGLVTSDGQPYELARGPVLLAHPMEMDQADLERWQKYFTSHGLKQPFEQVWEPVVNFDTVREDRYQGMILPANQLRSQEKHGIEFSFDYGISELETSFTGLDLECDFTQFQSHWMEQNATVIFGKLQVKQRTRTSNHVLARLDRWLVAERVRKDDATVVDMLDGFTLAQVTELLNLAIENNCTNCTAALLDYKNNRFPDFDPMDVFTLD